jgi:hypothetical protein
MQKRLSFQHLSVPADLLKRESIWILDIKTIMSLISHWTGFVLKTLKMLSVSERG